MIVSKTRNAPGWATKEDNLIPNGVKCNENVIWVSVLRLDYREKIITSSREFPKVISTAFVFRPTNQGGLTR